MKKIRLAKPTDAKTVAEIRQKTWISTYKGLIPERYFEKFNLEKETENFYKLFSEQKISYVIELDKKIVGFFILSLKPIVLPKGKSNISVGAFYIEKEHQKQGLGSFAFDYIKAMLKEQNYKNFAVCCLKTNDIGKSFYKKQGGIVIGEVLFNNDLLEECFLFKL